MHIFIDESGSFSGYHIGSLGVVGALCVPDSVLPKLTQKYLKLRPALPQEKGKVKGRLLIEAQVNRVAELLIKNQAIFEVTVLDLGAHKEAGVVTYRDQLAAEMEQRLHRFNADAQLQVKATVAQIRSTPPQLFLQALATMDALEKVITHIPLYFAQRAPHELGSFKWVVDAKQQAHTTDWERWWSTYCQGALATRSKMNPRPELQGADYSHFARYKVQQGQEIGTDLKLLFADVRFSSASEPGLEMVDILTNAIRRALIGNLAEPGWSAIPRLMIHRRQHYISLMRLEGASDVPVNPPYERVMRRFRSGGKSMLSPRFLALADKEEREES